MRDYSNDLYSLSKKRGTLLERRVDQLAGEMVKCAESGRAINLSTPKHNETTQALNRLVYTDGETFKLNIRYNDTPAKYTFPLRLFPATALPDRFNPAEGHHIRLGTCSFRHLNYDKHVDLYLVRDKDTRGLHQADVDLKAYMNMKKLLEETRNLPSEKRVFLSIFQAGLEPLAVGMNRALVEDLVDRAGKGLSPLTARTIIHVDDNTGEIQEGCLWGVRTT